MAAGTAKSNVVPLTRDQQAAARKDAAARKAAEKAAKANGAEGSTPDPKPAAAKSTEPRKPRASKYSEEVRDAVKRSKEIRGSSHGEGPAQHVTLRALVTKLLKAEKVEPTPQSIAKLAGFPGASGPKDLHKVAEGKGDRTATKPLRELLAQVPADAPSRAWTQGRFGAAILAAWSDQLAAK